MSRFLLVILFMGVAFVYAQEPTIWVHTMTGERVILPSYRIAENPAVVDTVIPAPTIQYPLLNKQMETEITVDDDTEYQAPALYNYLKQN